MAPPPPLHGLGSLVILVVDLPRVDQDSRGVEPATTQSQSHSIMYVEYAQWRSCGKNIPLPRIGSPIELNSGPNFNLINEC